MPRAPTIASTGTSHNESQIAETRNARAAVGRACSGNSVPSRLAGAVRFAPGTMLADLERARAGARTDEADQSCRQHNQRERHREKEDANKGEPRKQQHRLAF